MARRRKSLVEAGFVRQLKACSSTLPKDAKAVYENGKAETKEDYELLRPFLKQVRVYRESVHAGGKFYEGQGKKELARAAKRVAKPVVKIAEDGSSNV